MVLARPSLLVRGLFHAGRLLPQFAWYAFSDVASQAAYEFDLESVVTTTPASHWILNASESNITIVEHGGYTQQDLILSSAFSGTLGAMLMLLRGH